MSIEDRSVTGAADRSNSSRSDSLDYLFLLVIGVLSISYYVSGLGFYSDDWALLASMRLSHDQSLINVFTEVVRGYDREIRPIQFFELAGLYKLFDLAPLGYHLVNATVIVFASILLYRALRALCISRMFAQSVCVIYLLLPNYSTDRFWIAVSAANISMLLFFWVFTPMCKPFGIAGQTRLGDGSCWRS